MWGLTFSIIYIYVCVNICFVVAEWKRSKMLQWTTDFPVQTSCCSRRWGGIKRVKLCRQRGKNMPPNFHMIIISKGDTAPTVAFFHCGRSLLSTMHSRSMRDTRKQKSDNVIIKLILILPVNVGIDRVIRWDQMATIHKSVRKFVKLRQLSFLYIIDSCVVN